GLALGQHGEVGGVALDQRPVDADHLGQRGDALLVGGVLGLGRGALGEHFESAARAAGEAVADVLLHDVGLGGGGQLAVVGGAELHAQEGQPEQDQHGRGAEGEERGAAHHHRRRAAPGGALLPLRTRRAAAPEQAPQVVRVDPVAEEDEGGGQQDQGRRRGQQHHGDPGVGEGAQEVLREEQHGRERHRDREGGEEHGAPGGAQGGADGGPGVGARGEFLAEAADDEQGVVDRQAEAERGGEVHREDGDVGDLGEAAQDRVGAEDRDDADAEREQGGDGAAEDHHQQHERDRQGDELGPQQVLLDDRLHLVPHGDRAADADLHGALLAPERRRYALQRLVHRRLVARDAGGNQRLVAVLGAQRGRAGLPVGADAGDAGLARQALGQPGGLGGDGRVVDRGVPGADEQQEVGLGVGERLLQGAGGVGGLGVRVLPAAAAHAVGDPTAGQHREDREHQPRQQGEPRAGRDQAGPASDARRIVDFGHPAV